MKYDTFQFPVPETPWDYADRMGADRMGDTSGHDTSGHSVSLWIRRLRQGDDEAAGLLWARYVRQIVDIARWKLGYSPKQAFDEEDVVVSVFDTFYRGVSNGRFPRLTDRTDLWRLLLVISHQKATDKKRHECRQKRGGGNVRSLEQLPTDGCLDQVLSKSPGPHQIAAIKEEHARLLGLLGDENLRRIAVGRLEGHSTTELAQELKVTTRTVQRKLTLIQSIWSAEL